MHQPDPPITIPIDIGYLERQVEALVDAYSRLRAENLSLRQSQEALVEEKAALVKKTELARTRVEAMIARLKAMEHGL
jgi:cell division protein ZapB